ncbi:hypothetical protein [Phaffia rhodozyma]|uniref:Uncharacterized protein n=1 Tax=Phaffia rhodozyma TaxID=264483 RepID=A0A0F7SS52_PHARH|nr:hypothetical protein [Phaffia rhodozyma]
MYKYAHLSKFDGFCLKKRETEGDRYRPSCLRVKVEYRKDPFRSPELWYSAQMRLIHQMESHHRHVRFISDRPTRNVLCSSYGTELFNTSFRSIVELILYCLVDYDQADERGCCNRDDDWITLWEIRPRSIHNQGYYWLTEPILV